MDAARVTEMLSPEGQVGYAREVIRQEGEALLRLAESLDESLTGAVACLFACQGSVIVTGMGKAGLIGQKIAATLASTGTRAHFLHPAEAMHGDLGRIHKDDCVLVLSQSGETEEIVRLLPPLARLGVAVLAITCRPNSSLGQAAAVTLDLGPIEEACSLGLAPSTSTTAMLAVGDALALVVSRMRQFGPEDFARFHPGGSLGRLLARVDDLMRPLAECRVALESHSVRQVLVETNRKGRRIGAIMLVREEGTLSGVFTDSDFARFFTQSGTGSLDEQLAAPIATVMTRSPLTVLSGAPVRAAVTLLADRKISELPVVDAAGRPVGMIDITDVVGLSRESAPETPKVIAAETPVDAPHGVPAPKTLPFVRPAAPRARK
jgi:arabinose-5-phosphate isomerase